MVIDFDRKTGTGNDKFIRLNPVSYDELEQLSERLTAAMGRKVTLGAAASIAVQVVSAIPDGDLSIGLTEYSNVQAAEHATN